MRKKPKPKAGKVREPSLQRRLYGPVRTPPLDKDALIATLTQQRDDVIHQLNLRANVDQAYMNLDRSLLAVERVIARLYTLNRTLSAYVNKIEVALELSDSP